MWGLLSGAFLAGLMGSPHCVGMCGGFASACSRPVSGAGAYHVGRLVTYATLGAIAGTVGHALPGPGWVLTVVAGGLTTLFALSLAGVLPSLAPTLPGLTEAAGRALRRGGMVGHLAFGAATGLLPCGLVYAALGVPVALADPALGALAMVLFGLGTVPLLLGATYGLRRLVADRLWARRALAAMVLLAGWWSIAMRQGAVAAHHDGEASQEAPPSCH